MADGSAKAQRLFEPDMDLLRARLRRVAVRLQQAVSGCRAAGFARLARVLSARAKEIERLLDASSLPETRIIENAVGRGEHAVAVWQDLAGF